MANLTMELAKKLVSEHVTEPHLIEHALAVSAAMGAMAAHFGADEAYWSAVGYAHDVDYEKWPEEHLQHTRPILEEADVDEETIRAILAHGWGCCCDVEPVTDLEKSYQGSFEIQDCPDRFRKDILGWLAATEPRPELDNQWTYFMT